MRLILILLTFALLIEISAPARADYTLKVMTFNVARKISTNSDINGEAMIAIANIINSKQPDIICFQETSGSVSGVQNKLTAWINARIPYLGGQHGFTYWVYVATDDDGSGTRQSLVSKYPLSDIATLFIGNIPIRGIPTAVVDLPGADRVRVYSAHLKSGSASADASQRQAEAEYCKQLLNQYNDGILPQIFCGDLNEDESNPSVPITSTYRPITTILEGGVVNQLIYACNNSYRTYSVATMLKRYDYILPTNYKTEFVNGSVINTTICAYPGLTATDSSTASDHCAVWADVTVQTTIVKGKAAPEGWLQGLNGFPVIATIKNGTTTIAQTVAPMNAQGVFTLPATDWGMYTVSAKLYGRLSQTIGNIALPTLSLLDFGIAEAGDADSNDVVDDKDLYLLMKDLGGNSLSGFITDFTGDGWVAEEDLNYLTRNLGKSGS